MTAILFWIFFLKPAYSPRYFIVSSTSESAHFWQLLKYWALSFMAIFLFLPMNLVLYFSFESITKVNKMNQYAAIAIILVVTLFLLLGLPVVFYLQKLS